MRKDMMRYGIALLLLTLATGCVTHSEFDPEARTVSPWSGEPVTLGPGVYRIQLPDMQPALLRVESCGAMHMDMVSETQDAKVETTLYGPESFVATTALTAKGEELANCVMRSDGSNMYFYMEGCSNTFIVLNDHLNPSTEMKTYTFATNINGNLILKELPNKALDATTR